MVGLSTWSDTIRATWASSRCLSPYQSDNLWAALPALSPVALEAAATIRCDDR